MMTMLDTKMKDAFGFIAPGKTQADEMFNNITRTPQQTPTLRLKRKPVLALCSLVLICALAFNILPVLNTPAQDVLTFAFNGLTMKVSAAETESGNLEVDMALFQDFSRIDVYLYTGLTKDPDGTTYAGYEMGIVHSLFVPPDGHVYGFGTNFYEATARGYSPFDETEPSVSMTLFREPIYGYGDIADAIMMFQAFGADGSIVAEGGIDLLTGALVEQLPLPESGNLYDARLSLEEYCARSGVPMPADADAIKE